MKPSCPSPGIVYECRDRILRIDINRPEKKNALTGDMYAALADLIEQAGSNPEVRVILLGGRGECFTSGNDLQDFQDVPPQGQESPVFAFLSAISQTQKPLVAAVSGMAVGVGTTMLLHCDLVYVGEGAFFQAPFVNLGLCPEAASSLLLPNLVGYQRAAEILLLGCPFSAEQAREMGLVNAVLPDEQVAGHAFRQACRLATQPPAAVRLAKTLMRRGQAEAVRETMAEEGRHFLQRLSSVEAAEAFRAFFEKRDPDFSDCV